ncbi:MAG: hypothetical protein IJM54_09350 [Thermoguttaceae bacterium]|nr:hypothetical protein [Thermoguttaceae bacterium]
MEYSSELLEAARNVYESEYAEWQERQEVRPVDVKRFKYRLEQVMPETRGTPFEECDKLLRWIRAKYQGTKPDFGSVGSGDYRDFFDDSFDPSENDYSGSDYAADEPSDKDVEETVRASARAERREALQTINEILDARYPSKTIFAAYDFDRIRGLFAAKSPRLGRDVSDLELKSLLFSAGATLIGKLRPREERLGAPGVSFSEPTPQEPAGKSKLTQLAGGSWAPQDDSYDVPSNDPDEYPPYDGGFREEVDDRFSPYPADDSYRANRNNQTPYGLSPYDEQSVWEEKQKELEEQRFGARPLSYDIPYQAPPRSSRQKFFGEEIGYVDDDYVQDRVPRRPARAVPSNLAGPRASYDAQRRASALRDLEAETKASDDEHVPFAEAVKAAREILQKYFPFRRVRMNRGLQKFRHFLEMRFSDFTYDNKKLYMVLKYAGGVYIGGYSTILDEDGRGSGGIEKSARASEVAAVPEPVLRGTREIVEEYFPDKIARAPGDLALFSKLFHERFQDVKLPESALTLLLENVGVEVQGQEADSSSDSTLDEAYVAVAKLVLKEHFSKAIFHEDLSDFKRFRIVFEEEAGPNAVLSDEKLVEVFRAAGGVFVSGSANSAESSKPTEVLSRAEVIKRIVSAQFVGGLNPQSHGDLEKFRKLAKENFNMDFSGEPDAKLAKIVARCLVPYEDKLYCATEKTKELIKERVASLFDSIGAIVAYYESFLNLNKDWLVKAGIDSEGLLQAYLEKYCPSYHFNEYYFEQTTSYLSERVKVENEIERVWGASESLSAEDLSKRVCVPADRIEKAMELNTDKFERRSNGEYRRRKKVGSSREPETLDDLFDSAFGLLDDPSSRNTIELPPADVKTVEEKAVEENEDSKKPSAPESASEAKAFVKSTMDAWFEEGGKLAYYQAFFDRWSEKLEEYGVADKKALVDLLAELYPNYCFRADYFEPERDDEDVVVKIKREMDRVWSEDTPARRVVDLIKSLYVTKEAFEEITEEEENLETLGVDKRSNGYLVRKPKKLEGKRPRRILKIKSKASKNSEKVVRKPSKASK